MTKDLEKALLAGGCFWGMQDLIRKVPGVINTRVGYSGGDLPNASYSLVKSGSSGHAEAIEVLFDPTRLTFRQLLEIFFQLHDPSTPNRQGNDVGSQYRSAIFYTSDDQKSIAEAIVKDIDSSGRWPAPVVTEVSPAKEFWEAEAEHQDYLERYPTGYTCHYVRPDWVLPKQ